MQLTCPHCQKTINVSQEEIALRGGKVVCPQCLGSYHIHTDLTAEQVLAARGRKKPLCPVCSREVPSDADVSFCPYCGSSLHPAKPEPEPEPEPEQPKPAREKNKPRSHHSNHHSNRQPVNLVPTLQYHHYQEPAQPASLRFQAAAWAVILALLAVLAYILYQSYLLLQLAND